MDAAKTAAIRDQNDRFRRGDRTVPGRIYCTSGVMALVREHEQPIETVIAAVRRFDAFTPDNDPHKTRDFGGFDHLGEKLFWIIDYYEPSMEFGAEDPSDLSGCLRVLTIMLASEY